MSIFITSYFRPENGHDLNKIQELQIQTSTLKNIQPKKNMKSFKCVKCEKQFSKVSEMENHLKWHKSQKKFTCSQCNAGFKIQRNLELHTAVAHTNCNLTKCPICQVSFSSQRFASLKAHLMLHQIEELYTCDVCKSEFANEVSIIMVKVIHGCLKQDKKLSVLSFLGITRLKLHCY